MGLRLSPEAADIRSFRSQYQWNAGQHGREFTLSDTEFEALIFGKCFYCAAEPKQQYASCRGNKLTIKLNGVDRIDNSKGYIPEDCVSCCRVCNHAKHSMTAEAFITW